MTVVCPECGEEFRWHIVVCPQCHVDLVVRGEGLQDLFGAGRMSAGFNYVVGPAQFWVRADDAERARGLLEGFAPTDPGDDDVA